MSRVKTRGKYVFFPEMMEGSVSESQSFYTFFLYPFCLFVITHSSITVIICSKRRDKPDKAFVA